MTDIVERLRAPVPRGVSRSLLMDEAADEIERLLAVVIKLQAERRQLKAKIKALTGREERDVGGREKVGENR